MTGRLVALIVFAVLAMTASSQCCNEPPKNYCPGQSSNEEGACAIFGRGHVHTFDGSRYDFHEFGDFVLFGDRDGDTGTFGSVHVRLAECTSKISQAVPTDKSGKYSTGTCVRSVVVTTSSGQSWEVKHSMNSPALDVFRNTIAQPVQTEYHDALDLYIAPMLFVDPYAATWRDKQSSLTDADYSVTFIMGWVVVNAMFYSSGETTVLVQGRPGFENTGGLCGFADNCPANDLTLREEPYFNPPEGALATALEARVLTTVSLNDDPIISAGSLLTGTQFINTTDKPQNWASLFASSWRVPLSQSRFADDGRNYNIRWYSASYDTPKGSCEVGLPAFLDKACAYDSAKSMDKDGWEKMSSRHLLVLYCLPYCNSGVFTSKLPELQAYHCNGICQYAEGTDLDIDEPFNSLHPPPLTLINNADKATLSLSSPLNLAGSYLVNLESHDFCGLRTQNVTLRLKCDSSITVRNPRLPAARIYRSPTYGWPTVQVIGADISRNVARVSWTWFSVPDSSPDLYDETSTSPSFTPLGPGNYTLQYALYDGCQIRRQLFTFVAECAVCDLTPIISSAVPMTNIWQMRFPDMQSGPQFGGGGSLRFYNQQVSADFLSEEPPLWSPSYTWFSLKEENFTTAKPLERIESVSLTVASVTRYPSLLARDFALVFPFGETMTQPTDTTISTTDSVNSVPSLTLARKRGPTGTQFGVTPPQREVDIRRSFSLTETTISVENSTTYEQVTKTANKRSICMMTWGMWSQTTAYTFNPQPLTPAETFTRGSLCARQYVVGLRLEEAGCERTSTEDTSVVDLTCGPNPEILMSCTGSSEFDFDDDEFSVVTLDASESYETYARQTENNWRFVSVPAGSQLMDGDLCGSEYSCPMTASFRPDVQGTYKVQYEFSNLCGVSTVVTDIVAHCAPQALVSDFTFTPATLPTFGAVLNQVVTPANPAGVDVSSQWSLTTAVVPFFFQNSAFFVDPSDWDTTLIVPLPGLYKVTHTVEVCGQVKNTTKDVTLTCSTSLTASLRINNTSTFPLVVTFDVNTQTWPPLVLDSSASTGAQQSLWYVGTASVDSGIVVTVDPSPYYLDLVTPVQLDLYTVNACDAKKATGSFKFACPAVTAKIFASSVSVLADEVVTLTTTGSIPSASVATYSFYANGTYLGSAASVTFSSSVSGVYVIVLDVFNGCGMGSASVTVTVRCPNTLVANPVASYPSDPSETVWRLNSFGIVRLGGAGVAEYGAYSWQVISAPFDSVYNVDPVVESFSSDTPYPPTTNTTDDFTMVTNAWVESVTTVTKTKTIFLDRGPSSSLNMSACIQPDVEGTYVLELTVADSCQTSKKQLSVVAKCGAAPLVSAHAFEANNQSFLMKASGWNKDNLVYIASLDRSAPRRVIIDASASTSSTSSHLQFYWSWAAPDARYNTLDAQAEIDNPWGSVATITLDHVGNYSLTLTVHDGCKITQVPVFITATCGTSPKLPLSFEGERTATVKGASPEGTTIYTFRITETSQKDCAYKNSWTVLDYSEGGSFSSGVQSAGVSLVPSFALFVSLLAFFFARF